YEYIDIAITNGEQGNAYVQKAGFLEEDGEYREALKYYERGAEKLPNDEKVKGKIEKLKMYI
ncbi:MAG TPA: tetratricopeptide repeat protein, partial [Patescibacteria group bacterium]|nr:tetratricopeptide repeat protein [Patescibacteria group bacterium]